jgi:hypothetical protein
MKTKKEGRKELRKEIKKESEIAYAQICSNEKKAGRKESQNERKQKKEIQKEKGRGKGRWMEERGGAEDDKVRKGKRRRGER